MYCIIDCETTGLDPVRHALISVGFILKPDLTKDYCVIKKEYRMNPGSYEVDPSALAVNGYTLEEIKMWPDRQKTAQSIDNMIMDWARMYPKVTPVGHNYMFDKGFLLQIMTNRCYETYFSYHYMDTMIAANFLKVARPGFANSVSLSALRMKYGLSNEGAHTALKDAEDTAEVARRLICEMENVEDQRILQNTRSI